MAVPLIPECLSYLSGLEWMQLGSHTQKSHFATILGFLGTLVRNSFWVFRLHSHSLDSVPTFRPNCAGLSQRNTLKIVNTYKTLKRHRNKYHGLQ